MLTVGEIRKCRLTCVFDSVCMARVARSRIAHELAACGRSCTTVRRAVEFGEDKVSVHRDFLSMEGGAEMRTS